MNPGYLAPALFSWWLTGLLILLVWSVGFGIYLNRIRSEGMASVRRLLRTFWIAVPLALSGALLIVEGGLGWDFVCGWLGGAESQMRIAQEFGRGDRLLRRDSSRSLYWLRKAAKNGNPWANHMAALLEWSGQTGTPDAARILVHARIAESAGFEEAMILIGSVLLAHPELAHLGETPESHFTKAIPILRAKADLQDPEASFSLGLLYMKGHGVPKNEPLGVAYLLRAKDSGRLDAFRALQVEQLRHSLDPSLITAAQELNINR